MLSWLCQVLLVPVFWFADWLERDRDVCSEINCVETSPVATD